MHVTYMWYACDMLVIWCGVPVLRVYGECVVVTIMYKLLQCFVHVYSVMYINGIWTWTYIYIWGGGEREQRKKPAGAGDRVPAPAGTLSTQNPFWDK